MPTVNRRYKIIRRLLPLIGVVVLLYILTQLDLPAVARIFAALNPWYCTLACFSVVPILLLANIEWQLLLKHQGIHVSFRFSMKNILIGFFYGFITPGGVGGYLQTIYLKQESKEPLPKCASNLLTLHTIDLITLLGLAVLGGALLIGRFPLLFVIFVALFVFTVVLFFFYLSKEASLPVFQRLLKTRVLQFVQNQFEDPLDSFFEQLPSFRAVVLPFVLSILGWFVSFSELYLISGLFHIDVPYLPFILIIAMANVVALLPISIYGLGTREVTLISLFSLFIVPSEQIVSMSLFWFAVVWLLPSIVGAFMTFHEHKKLGSLRPHENSDV